MIQDGYGIISIKDELETILAGWDKSRRYRLVVRHDKNFRPISFSVRPMNKKEMDKFNKS